MIVPHAEVALEGLLVDVEEVVVGGDAASSTDVLEGFELRQRQLRQCFGYPDQGQHLFFPLRE